MERTCILIMLNEIKACANLLVSLIGVMPSVLFLGCSSKDTPKSSDAQMDSAVIYYEEMPPDVSVPNISIDSSQATPVIPATNDVTSTFDLSVNPYYDAGYEQGQEDGYNDGIENIRGDSYDDVCRYKGRKGRSMSLGMKKDMMLVSMMAAPIVAVILKSKNNSDSK